MPTSWPSAAGARSTSGRRSSPRSSGAAARRSSWAGRTRRSARSGSSTARSTWSSTGRPRTPGPSSARTSLAGSPLKPVYKQIGNIDMQKSPGAPLRPHPEGRLPLLLHPDDPGLPVRVRVLRHHRHRRPRPAAEVDPPGPQGDRDHRRPRREVHQLLRREPHREPEVRRAAPGGDRRRSAGRTTIPSSSPPR